MKKMLVALLLGLSAVPGFSQHRSTIAIIPQPVSIRESGKQFHINSASHIEYLGTSREVERMAHYLAGKLNKKTDLSLTVVHDQPGGWDGTVISLSLYSTANSAIGNEGYTLTVDEGRAEIKANKPAGLFYGIQTLLQLLPPVFESDTTAHITSLNMPAVTITDYPRFAWRGLMFDVARHFFTRQEVKDFIDQMVKYKYNMLHLHLTDDQGWRIEIKSLPKLTEVGAWRVDKTGTFGTFSKPEPDEPKTYGGFYTQEDIKELVKYAADRFVNIMPEVDVPGHSMAAVASYPELSCTPGEYRVNSGEKFMQWGVGSAGFSALIDNTLCPANEKVYTFLDKVFTEIAQLFPFEYIHMGGDECAKNFWEKDPQIKQLMQQKKLKDMHEVQSYFVGRVAKIIQSKGKKMIGWDEILEGGLVPGAAVMSWRGIKGGREAASKGHQVVMSPNTNVYLDLMQGDPAIEAPVYSTVLLKSTYAFEPVPEGVDAKMIKGGQGNIWTEQIYNTRHLQYMMWPRAFAVAESVWSQPEAKDWDNFIGRVEQHFKRFDAAHIKYAPSMYEPLISVSKNAGGELQVSLTTEVKEVNVHYSFDNSFPDNFYPAYKGTLTMPKDASRLRLVSYKGNEQVGRIITIDRESLEKRVKK